MSKQEFGDILYELRTYAIRFATAIRHALSMVMEANPKLDYEHRALVCATDKEILDALRLLNLQEVETEVLEDFERDAKDA
jgi:hypothetical protein